MAGGVRELTRQVAAWLKGPDLATALAQVGALPPDKLVKPLFSCLCAPEPRLKWHAVSAFGQTVAALAGRELEAARVVIRRCMWMLNDESGGIGWGVPEAMAEALARHPGLAAEYTHILVAFMREDGFYLELPALQQGLLWGVARLAEIEARRLREREAARYLRPYLDSGDQLVIGLACLALGRLGDRRDIPAISSHRALTTPSTIYQNGEFITRTVAQLAEEAISLLGG
ncbi:MAG: HEAT repeat domain-containing protein [Desulfobacteraceae bacterium]|nr:HEAT repeat domain-containing protein [Desulfobacteraceae bacterium]